MLIACVEFSKLTQARILYFPLSIWKILCEEDRLKGPHLNSESQFLHKREPNEGYAVVTFPNLAFRAFRFFFNIFFCVRVCHK